MKKILFLLIVVASLFQFSVAQELDVSSMNYDDLLSIRSEINEAINGSMNFMPFVPDGYAIGEDIPEGIYEFSVIELYPTSWSVLFKVYSNDELLFDKLISEGEKVACKLEKGNDLVITGGVLHLELIG